MGVYLRAYSPYYPESIVYKMNADSNWKLYVPVAWCSTWWSYNCAYNWKVSVDDGAFTTYSGTWSSGGTIQMSWYTVGTNHTITITPTTEAYQWCRAFWFINVSASIKALLTDILYDGSYMGYWVSATDTWAYFRYNQYAWCTWLTNIPEKEYMPNTVTTIWSNFMQAQYQWCTSLTTPSDEALSSWVTTIW